MKKLLLFLLLIGHSTIINAQDLKLQSFFVESGQHSIGFPFAFRTPYHFNLKTGLQFGGLNTERKIEISLGFLNRPHWSNDVLLVGSRHHQKNLYSNKLFLSWHYGIGTQISCHFHKIYQFKDGSYTPKKLNIKISGLITSGISIGRNLKGNFRIELGHQWQLLIPHGGGLPFLPHSYYQFRITKMIQL